MTEKPVALVDLDGTLADFDLAMQESLAALRAPCEEKGEIGYGREQPDHIWNRMEMIKSRGDWWETLPRIEGGFSIVRLMLKLGYNISILTQGPRDNPVAWSHKVKWCKAQPEISDSDITITRNKGLVYGRVLMDDYPKYILQWLEHRPRGLVIMPDHKWNVSFEHPNVIRLVDNLPSESFDRIKEALTAARDRLDKEELNI